MNAWLIQRTDVGTPCYFSIATGRSCGAGPTGGWDAAEKATGFARQTDAQQFAEAFLPHVAPVCAFVQVDLP